MKTIDAKLASLQDKLLTTNEKVRILIFGLGSVGVYLLDYLVSLADPRLELIVCGRNREKMQSDVNIVRTAATIRRQLRSNILIEKCDLEKPEEIADVLRRTRPDFIVNAGRVYSGLKYGSISWHNLRAYGIWTPLSVKFAANIVRGIIDAQCDAISINTSYSDAVIPWIKSALGYTFDFGSGNLNHLIPRMKFYVAEKFGIDNVNDIDITLAASHFHDVVISKEGQPEGQTLPISVEHKGRQLDVDIPEMLAACAIAMPTDQKRNMMNASSNFDIINSILTALREHRAIRIHTPGVAGEIGGFPYIIDGAVTPAKACFDTSRFSMESMREANRNSIYLDGIKDVADGELEYTPELLAKVKEVFGVELPARFSLDDSGRVATLIIDEIITPALK